jgi:Lar family restriction alleviation protein
MTVNTKGAEQVKIEEQSKRIEELQAVLDRIANDYFTEQEELKPCPFCGCDQIQSSEMDKWVVPYARYCRNCRAYGPHKRTYEEAIEAWNTRTKGDIV